MIKILHAADIHLDAPFSLSDPIEAERRRTGLRSTFCSLIHTAKLLGTEIFIIAGDLFESSFVTRDTVELVIREIASFPECLFFITPGNHDPYTMNSPYKLFSWPKNTRIFTREAPSYFDVPEKNLRVYGHAYVSKSVPGDLFSNFKAEDTSKINILAAHGFVNIPQSACNILMKSDIEKSGFDYIALGHVHTSTGIEKEGNVPYAYCGCTVGRSFDECGYKGVLVGEISKEQGLRINPIKCCDKRFEILSCDVSGSKTTEEALSVISEKASQYGEDTALRIIAEGAVSPGVTLDKTLIRSTVRNPFYIEFRDMTSPILDAESLKEDKTVLGAYYRKLEPMLFSDDPEVRAKATLALRYGISALGGNDIHID